VGLFESATGSLAAKTDAGATYNAGTGVLTATGFAGPLVGNVTGNCSGTAATVTEGTQASITSAANLVTVGTIGTGTWEATDVGVAHGGTGVSTLADGGLVIGNAAGAVEVVAAGATTEILVGGGASTAPVWGTDIPTAVTIGSAYVYRVGGTDVADADVVDDITVTSTKALSATSGTFSGALTGLLSIEQDSDGETILTAECAGSMWENTGANIYVLPGAAPGLNCCFYAIDANVITIDPADGTDTIYLEGVTVGAGDTIESSGAIGEFICLYASDATIWRTLGMSGTWADSNP